MQAKSTIIGIVGTLAILFGLSYSGIAKKVDPNCPCVLPAETVPHEEPDPTKLDISIDGDSRVPVGEQAVLRAKGNFDTCGWISEHKFKLFDNGLTMTFSTAKPGTYKFWLYGAKCDPMQKGDVVWEVTVGDGPVIPSTPTTPVDTPTPVQPPVQPTVQPITAATYVYEKTMNPVPKGVLYAFDKINRDASRKIIATIYEDPGSGQVSIQHAEAYAAAKTAGIPCIVLMSGKTAVKVIKNPTTEAHVMENLK